MNIRMTKYDLIHCRIVLLIVLLVIFHSACKEQSLPPPNILWITNEDTGPAWGCYGDNYAITPNIDHLAKSDGAYIFEQAFSNAPVCAPARSTLITGMYATSLGTQHLRSEIPVPEDLKILPELLKEYGYYTTNNSKTDYNFNPSGRWHENDGDAHWQNRPDGKPFFSVFNFGITHEGHTNDLNPNDTEILSQLHTPSEAILPPYFPNNESFRDIWAHMSDLMTVFDQEVGNLIQQLKENDEYENTIIFIFSDHGFGLPRYKRWLHNSGLHVPFVLYVPPKYKHLVSGLPQSIVNQMVSFVDFAPTVLQLAGIKANERMEGKSFLDLAKDQKEYTYGYRSRADDCYDVSRSIYDGRYLYIRHYMPHKPYMQNAIIFNKGKASYDALFAARETEDFPEESKRMFERKPIAELYDLKRDPYELNNLIEQEAFSDIADTLHEGLMEWMIKYHDTGLLNEADMMMRSKGESVFEMARNETKFPVREILEAAERVGRITDINELTVSLTSSEPAVRYWSLVALDAYEGDISIHQNQLISMLNDTTSSNSILAAELLVKHFENRKALDRLGEMLQLDFEPIVLQAAISVRMIGRKAMPLLPLIQEKVIPKFEGEVWGRYKNWLYPMFIGMALDQTLLNCDIEVTIKN